MSEDTISRQAAIEEIKAVFEWHDTVTMERMVEHFKNLPSAQPETHDKRTETHSCDLISRQAAIDALNVGAELLRRVLDDAEIVGTERAKYEWGLGLIESYISDMKELPSAQPEQTNSWCINSWCIDCKEYDTENKCCPRYNRVIKQTLDDAYRHGETEAEARFHAQQRWIPCSERLPFAEYGESDNVLATCGHRDGEDTSVRWINTLYFNGGCWCYPTGETYDQKVYAWMPLPEPYTEDKE